MAHTVQLGNIIWWTLYQTLGIFANHEDVLSTNLLYFTYSIVYKNSLDREDFPCMGVSNFYSIPEALYFHYIVCTFVC